MNNNSQPSRFVVWIVILSGFSPLTLACSCQDYWPASEQPDWVDKEQVNQQGAFSFALSYCTGVKAADIKRVNQLAFANIGRLIQARISSKQTITQVEYANGVSDEQYRHDSLIMSDIMVNNAHLYAHWLSLKTCNIYAAVTIDSSAMSKVLQTHQQRLSEQIFYVPEQFVLVRQQLLQANIKLSSVAKHADIILTIKDAPKTTKNKDWVSFLYTASLVDSKTKAVLWSQAVVGKGISFEPTHITVLKQKAFIDGQDKLAKQLLKYVLVTSDK